MLIWAVPYLFRSLEVLKGPFYSIRMSYEAEAGTVTLLAEKVDLNLYTGFIKAVDLKLFDETGNEVARASTLDLYAAFPWVAPRRWHGTVNDVALVVERVGKAKWNLQTLFPKPPKVKPPPTPFVFQITNCKAIYRDKTLSKPYAWNVTISECAINGFGDTWDTSFDASIRGTGNLAGDITADEEGLLSFQAYTEGLDVGTLREYLASLPELAEYGAWDKWSVSDAFVSGTIRWQRGGENNILRGSTKLVAKDLRIGDFFFDNAEFEGDVSERSLLGDFNVYGDKFSADAYGALFFSPRIAFRFEGSTRVDSPTVLKKLFKALRYPPDLQFQNAHFTGFLQWDETLIGNGHAEAEALRWKEYRTKQLRANVSSDGKILRLSKLVAHGYGSPIEGELSFTIEDNPTVFGFLEATTLNAAQLPWFPKEYFSNGNLNVSAILTGSLNSPRAVINGQGNITVALEENGSKKKEKFDAQGRALFDGSTIEIQAFHAEAPSGIIQAKGKIPLTTEGLDLRIRANSLDLAMLPKLDLQGTSYVDLRLLGSFKEPLVTGLMEVYEMNLTDYSIPFASARIEYSNKRLLLENLVARSGVTMVRGNAQLQLDETQTISGGGEIVDFGLSAVTDERIHGLLKGTWTLGGKLEQPVVIANVSGEKIFADKVPIESVKFIARYEGRRIHLDEFLAKLDDGTLTMTGEFPLEGTGALTAKLENLSPSVFLNYLTAEAIPEGRISATFTGSFADGELKTASFESRLSDITVNEEPVGSGFINAQFANGEWTANAEFGNIQGFYVLENGLFRPNTEEISGTISALNADVATLIRVASEDLKKNVSPDVYLELKKLRGKLTSQTVVAGTLDNPNLMVSLIGNELGYQLATGEEKPKDLGEFELQLARNGGRWDVHKAEWREGPIVMRMSGEENYFVEDGDISMNGEIEKLDLSWLALWIPELSDLSGNLYIPFRVSGKTRTPEILASISGREVKWADLGADGLNIDALYIREGAIQTEQGTIEKKGALYVRGFAAELIDLSIPFRYPFEFPKDEPMHVMIHAPQRDLNDLSAFFGGLDTRVTKGTFLGGALEVTGTLEQPDIRGNLAAVAERLKFMESETVLRLDKAELNFGEKSIARLILEGGGETQGSFVFRGGYDIETATLLSDTYFEAQNLPFRQSFDDGTVVSGILDAKNIYLRGSLEEMTVQDMNPQGELGHLRFSQGSLLLGTGLITPGVPIQFPVEVNLNLEHITIEPSVLRSGPLDATFSGFGTLRGSLQAPHAEATFIVHDGEISLPTGPVNLERGGSASFTYARTWQGETGASLRVTLPATTQILAFDGLSVQRYRINLLITGDLFEQRELQIDASSDPPGLTREQIMAALGQEQLFTALGSAVTGGIEREISGVLYAAAPGILSPITRAIEKGLALDFLLFQISPTGKPVMVVGKEIGKGFTLEFLGHLPLTRETSTGLQEPDQIQLVFRPPTRNLLWNRLSLSLGYDTNRDWRASATYSMRF
ncbi:MAG TPA: hypothetical protein VNK96_03185 [Fimbriimonadales bacterium]|nr:hypothetical protein [Fimbriimonadales bacterium]